MEEKTTELEKLRHSAAHIMAQAVKQIYPDCKLGIGPAIENGFYYDFDAPLKEEDLPLIENKMKEIIAADYSFRQEFWDKEKARKYFAEKKEVYKLELLEDISGSEVSIYRNGDFLDLCKGPHIESTGKVQHFKLLHLSGAYWRGNEKNKMLTRIYGTAFFTKKELKEYLKLLEEAKKRDHRTLGRQLNLFDIYYDQAGAGLVFYLPAGAILRRIIEDWEINEHLARGYEIVTTPHIMKKQLWEQSGHWEYYREYMYKVDAKEEDFILKPMNCPGHILIYQSQLRSYKDLPLRIFELGTVYRHEKSGVLHGLLRVRGFTQDDAHIFCAPQDLSGEIKGILAFVREALAKFGFSEFEAELSTRPEKFIGNIEDWDKAEDILAQALTEQKIAYKVNPQDGAFYGPKIDIKLKDALGRSWQCATIQLDYSLPKRFNLAYIDAQGQKQTVIMVHRVILGSLERFIATLVEHYAGKFPLWLSPVQVTIINVTERAKDYALEINKALIKQGFRSRVQIESETLQKKIRIAELQKIPYIIIVGDKEKEAQTISLRGRGKINLGQVILNDFIERLNKEVAN